MTDIFPKTLTGFYWQLTKRFWPFVFGLMFLYIIYDVLNQLLPSLTIKWVVDGLEAIAPGIPIMTQMMPILVLIGSMVIGMLAVDILAAWIDGKYAPLVGAKTGEIIYNRMTRQSVAFFKDNAAGLLVEQANNVLGLFQKICIHHINEAVAMMISISISVGLLLQVHWLVAALFAVCAMLRLTHCAFHVRQMWMANKTAAKLRSELVSKHVDSISNFMNIKLFSRRNDEQMYLNKARITHAKSRQEANYQKRKFWVLPYSFEQICTILMMFLLIWLYGADHLKLGDVAFSMTAFATMMRLVRNMTWKMNAVIDDLSTAEQAYKDIAKPNSITDSPTAKTLKTAKCKICFENVSFKYKEDNWVFKNLNLCIEPGEKVGIVGLSGSGKSTLLYLLMRLYDVNSGAIKIDGQDLRDVTLESLRGAVSFVPQDCTLFNRTLAENISYGSNNSKKSDITNAAKMAAAHDFIMKTEQGYDTCVGDRGIALSGGQRQRVSIAHAICKNAPILVMDEATSALDSKTERAVQNALSKMLRDRTAMVVAHRLSTLRHMDRIVVMDKGRIAEQGTHAELLKIKDGIYAKLWGMQSDGFVQ